VVRAAVRGTPFQEGLYDRPAARRRLTALLADEPPFDLVVVQLVRCAWAAEVVAALRPGTPLLYDAVDSMALHFARAAESSTGPRRWLAAAESERCRRREAWLAGRSRADSEVTARLPFTELRGRVEDLQRQRDEQRRRLETLEASSRRREHELNHALGEMRESGERLRGDLGVAREQLDGTLRELETHKSELASARAELEMWRGWRESFDRKLPVRIYHTLRRLLGR